MLCRDFRYGRSAKLQINDDEGVGRKLSLSLPPSDRPDRYHSSTTHLSHGSTCHRHIARGQFCKWFVPKERSRTVTHAGNWTVCQGKRHDHEQTNNEQGNHIRISSSRQRTMRAQKKAADSDSQRVSPGREIKPLPHRQNICRFHGSLER